MFVKKTGLYNTATSTYLHCVVLIIYIQPTAIQMVHMKESWPLNLTKYDRFKINQQAWPLSNYGNLAIKKKYSDGWDRQNPFISTSCPFVVREEANCYEK